MKKVSLILIILICRFLLQAQENTTSKAFALGFQLKSSCYFIEAGGIGTGATADKIPTSPIYSNGFMISTGLRIHIK